MKPSAGCIDEEIGQFPQFLRRINYDKNYKQNPPSVLRLPVDGTAVLAAVRRRDGMLRYCSPQGRDGTVVRPSKRPNVLDGYGDHPYLQGRPQPRRQRCTHWGFYTVVHPEWMGVVTSGASLERQLNQYPGARTFSAFTWSRFHDLWTLDCTEFHDHETSRPRRAPGILSRGCDEAIRVEEEAKRVKKEEMEYLAAAGLSQPPARPSPVPARFGTGGWHTDPSPSSGFDRCVVMDGNDHLRVKRSCSPQANIGGAPPAYSDFDNSEPGPSTPEGMKNEPHLYGVSGHSRLFRSKTRCRAPHTAALGSSPIAGMPDFTYLNLSNLYTIYSLDFASTSYAAALVPRRYYAHLLGLVPRRSRLSTWPELATLHFYIPLILLASALGRFIVYIVVPAVCTRLHCAFGSHYADDTIVGLAFASLFCGFAVGQGVSCLQISCLVQRKDILKAVAEWEVLERVLKAWRTHRSRRGGRGFGHGNEDDTKEIFDYMQDECKKRLARHGGSDKRRQRRKGNKDLPGAWVEQKTQPLKGWVRTYKMAIFYWRRTPTLEPLRLGGCGRLWSWLWEHHLSSSFPMAHGITSSHALCNPSRRVQLSRVHRMGASGASKATQTLLTAKAKKRKIDLNNEVDDFFAERNKKITELAACYCKKKSDIHVLLCNTSQLKAHRRPNLRNGVLHQRALDLQERGISKHLKELQAELDDDLLTGKFSYESISKTEGEHLINQVLRKRHDRRRSMRATTKAAQIDTKLTAKPHGVRAFAFFARGSADDPSHAHCVDSDDALDFLTQQLDFTAPHFMRKFEQWSCTLDEGARLRNGVNTVRKEVSGMFTDRLRKVTKDPKAKMDYVGFRVKVMEKYGVEVASFELPGTHPSTWNIDLARFVRDGLVDGTIDFVQMTQDQRDDLAAELNAERAAKGACCPQAPLRQHPPPHLHRRPKRTYRPPAGSGSCAQAVQPRVPLPGTCPKPRTHFKHYPGLCACAHPKPEHRPCAPACISIPNQNTDPMPTLGPHMLGVQGSFPDDWAGAIRMNDGFDPFGGLGFLDASQMLVLPSNRDLDLDEIHRAPALQRSGGRTEGEEDDDADQPPLQRRRHQNAPPHKVRSDKGKKRDQPVPQGRGGPRTQCRARGGGGESSQNSVYFEGVVREAAVADSSSDGIDGAPFAPSSAPGMMATMAVIIYSQEIIY
ncbi:hypothetical protein B0H14DRAFT_2644732 [Mycena olivaceomarginata]|nr:hypothetical protein B0H14DRAFT_2644732 [Mycena olivaceomarginata]